jgi:hypothetical protein
VLFKSWWEYLFNLWGKKMKGSNLQ